MLCQHRSRSLSRGTRPTHGTRSVRLSCPQLPLQRAKRWLVIASAKAIAFCTKQFCEREGGDGRNEEARTNSEDVRKVKGVGLSKNDVRKRRKRSDLVEESGSQSCLTSLRRRANHDDRKGPTTLCLLTQIMPRRHVRQQLLFGGRPKRLLFAIISVVSCSHLYSTYKLNKVVVTENGRHLATDMTGAPTRKEPSSIVVVDPQSLSSVDYMACCGAGHRMSKLAEAHYLSHRLGFGLRPYWGYCDTYSTRQQQTEVFQYVPGVSRAGRNSQTHLFSC